MAGWVQLANPALKERHWEKIFCIVGQEYEAGAPVHVQQLLDSGVLANFEEVQTVATNASKEYSMLKMLEKMEMVRLSAASQLACILRALSYLLTCVLTLPCHT